MANIITARIDKFKTGMKEFRELPKHDKLRRASDAFFNNAMVIVILLAVIVIAILQPKFLSLSSIINIISLTAAKLPSAVRAESLTMEQLGTLSNELREITNG